MSPPPILIILSFVNIPIIFSSSSSSHPYHVDLIRNSLVTGYINSALNYASYCQDGSTVANNNGILSCSQWSSNIPGRCSRQHHVAHGLQEFGENSALYSLQFASYPLIHTCHPTHSGGSYLNTCTSIVTNTTLISAVCFNGNTYKSSSYSTTGGILAGMIAHDDVDHHCRHIRYSIIRHTMGDACSGGSVGISISRGL